MSEREVSSLSFYNDFDAYVIPKKIFETTKLSSNEKLIYSMIIKLNLPVSEISSKSKELAKLSGLSVTTVLRSFKKLEKMNLIKINDPGGNQPATYTLIFNDNFLD